MRGSNVLFCTWCVACATRGELQASFIKDIKTRAQNYLTSYVYNVLNKSRSHSRLESLNRQPYIIITDTINHLNMQIKLDLFEDAVRTA